MLTRDGSTWIIMRLLVVLLVLVLFTVVTNGDATTESSIPSETTDKFTQSAVSYAEAKSNTQIKLDDEKTVVDPKTDDDIKTDTEKKAEADTTPDAETKSDTETQSDAETKLDAGESSDELKTSESVNRFSYTSAKAENEDKSDKEELKDDDVDSDIGNPIKLLQDALLDLLTDPEKVLEDVDTGEKIPVNENSDESSATAVKDDFDPVMSAAEEIQSIHTPQEELNPRLYQSHETIAGYGQSPEGLNQEASPDLYFSTKERPDSSVESGPLLQLTQGGYQRPYQLQYNNEQVSRPDTNGGSDGRQQGLPHMSYSAPYRTQFSFGPGPVMKDFYSPQEIFSGQNGFINPEFAYQPTINSGGSRFVARRPLVPDSAMLFENAFHLPGSRQMEATRAFYPFNQYASFSNSDETSRPDYSELFRSSNYPVESQYYGGPPNSEGTVYSSPEIHVLENYPRNESPFSPRYIPYLPPAVQNLNPNQQVGEGQGMNTADKANDSNTTDSSEMTLKPFGNQIQKEGDSDQNVFQDKSDVYIKYPTNEAGYATEVANPAVQNSSETRGREGDTFRKPPYPFFQIPNQFQVLSGSDPYRNALNMLQQQYREKNNETEQIVPAQYPGILQSQRPTPNPLFETYVDRGRVLPELPTPVYFGPTQNLRRPFEAIYYGYTPEGKKEEPNKVPKCAQETNSSICFDDPEYPIREILYAINSDSYLLDRLVMPEMLLDDISLVDSNNNVNETSDNYICKSDIRSGFPLRSLNLQGRWKVIVNVERAMARGRFRQPVRTEECKGNGDPCSFTDNVKTACVQKFSLQRLLSWSEDKGVHSDVFKLPVACSCQITETMA